MPPLHGPLAELTVTLTPRRPEQLQVRFRWPRARGHALSRLFVNLADAQAQVLPKVRFLPGALRHGPPRHWPRLQPPQVHALQSAAHLAFPPPDLLGTLETLSESLDLRDQRRWTQTLREARTLDVRRSDLREPQHLQFPDWRGLVSPGAAPLSAAAALAALCAAPAFTETYDDTFCNRSWITMKLTGWNAGTGEQLLTRAAGGPPFAETDSALSIPHHPALARHAAQKLRVCDLLSAEQRHAHCETLTRHAQALETHAFTSAALLPGLPQAWADFAALLGLRGALFHPRGSFTIDVELQLADPAFAARIGLPPLPR